MSEWSSCSWYFIYPVILPKRWRIITSINNIAEFSHFAIAQSMDQLDSPCVLFELYLSVLFSFWILWRDKSVLLVSFKIRVIRSWAFRKKNPVCLVLISVRVASAAFCSACLTETNIFQNMLTFNVALFTIVCPICLNVSSESHRIFLTI